MKLQSDLAVEANNLRRFNENFRDFPDVVFPTVIDSSKSVLVETFEEGESIANYMKKVKFYGKTTYNKSDKMSEEEFEKERKKTLKEGEHLARLGLKAYLKMMLHDNFIHADLHPGNILVRKKKKHTEEKPIFGILSRAKDEVDLEVVFLDVGLVTECTPSDWSHFKQLFKSVVTGNGKLGAELMVKYARSHKIMTDAQRAAYVEEMNAVFNQIATVPMNKINVGDFLGNILRVVQKYQVQIEGNFATLCVGTAILEGIGKQLNPELNLFQALMLYFPGSILGS